MEVSFDQYVRNIRMFYNQLIKGHPKEEQLAPKFKQMIESQTKKWRKVLAIRKDNRSGQTATLLTKLKQQKGVKGKSKINVNVLYASTDIRNQIVFGYCFLLMEHKNPTALQFLTQNMKQHLENKQKFNEPLLRKVRNLWDKMQQVVAGRRRIVRFQKQLQDCFKDMPQFIVELLFQIISNNSEISRQSPQQFLKELTSLLGIKIQYFKINEKQAIQFQTFGETFDLTMKFGFFSKQKIFGYVSQLPQKQEDQVNKQVTMKCFMEIAEVLGSMYQDNEKEFLELTTVNNKTGKLRRSGSLAGNGVQSRFTAQKSKISRSPSMNFGDI